MNIKIYTNTSENNKLNKSITSLLDTNCNLKRDTTLTDPLLELVGVAFSGLKYANYMYIPDFGRYYFISNISYNSGGIAVITGHVDVLMSFKSQISNSSGILRRQESIFNAYLPDDDFYNDNRTKTAFKNFGVSMPEQKCFLYTV